MIPGMPLGTQFAAGFCRLRPSALPASNASTWACAAGVSLGGVGVVREPVPTPGDHTPLQSGQLVTSWYAVARPTSWPAAGTASATHASRPEFSAILRMATPAKSRVLRASYLSLKRTQQA